MKGQDISAYMGRITIADRTYLNGTLIGTEGNFLPQEFTTWNTTRLYEIPESIVNYDSDNELCLTDIRIIDENTITIIFGDAPETGVSYKFIINR